MDWPGPAARDQRDDALGLAAAKLVHARRAVEGVVGEVEPGDDEAGAGERLAEKAREAEASAEKRAEAGTRAAAAAVDFVVAAAVAAAAEAVAPALPPPLANAAAAPTTTGIRATAYIFGFAAAR